MIQTVIIVLRNVLTVLTYVISWGSKYCKKKSTMVLCATLSTTLSGISHFLFNAYTAAWNSISLVLRGFITVYKDKHNKPLHSVYVMFTIFFIVNTYLTWDGLYCLCIPFSSIIVTTAFWYIKDTQALRICYFVSDISSVIYMLVIRNYIGAALIVVSLITCVTSWLKYHKEDIVCEGECL